MLPMPVGDLHAISRELAETGRRVHVLWQEPETLLFVARGREYRSEFHINPSSEVMYMISGEMNLHYRDPDGKEDIQVLKAGEAVYTAPLIPHSPRFPPDAFLLVQERRRRPGEIDRFPVVFARNATASCTRRSSSSSTMRWTRSRRPTAISSMLRRTAPALPAVISCPHRPNRPPGNHHVEADRHLRHRPHDGISPTARPPRRSPRASAGATCCSSPDRGRSIRRPSRSCPTTFRSRRARP